MLPSQFDRLKKRRDFVRLTTTSWRFVLGSFVIQMAPRLEAPPPGTKEEKKGPESFFPSSLEKEGKARVGFTVTRRIGNAVIRNRVKRRLRAAVFNSYKDFLPSYDYVVVARHGALLESFEELEKNLRYGVYRLHKMVKENSPFSPYIPYKKKKK